MKRKIIKRCMLVMTTLLMGIVLMTGCDNPIASLTGSGGSADSGDVVELADNTEIPEDGIITAAQFRSIEGKDRTVTFTGSTSDGTQYIWTFNGKDIQNPQDQNLKVEFTGDGVDAARAAAGNASYGMGLKLDNKGMICVPQLTVKFTQKLDIDSALLIKMDNGQPAKISNVTFDADSDVTSVTMNITQSNGTFYLVGGKGATAGSTVQDATGGGTESSGSRGSNSGSSGSGQSGPTCTISISCSTILNNMGDLTSGKEEFVPSDGWILPATTVTFTEGESVHDVLQRVCRERGIHMESSWTPAYNSAYVEGINQLYEFDCGQNSGWMYNVNGWFPNYGCSKYTVKDGDVINWVYTCNLGEDVGDNSMW